VRPRPARREAQERQASFFEAHDRDWFTKAVAYHLADFPQLADFRPWYPALISTYFARQSWHRPTDPEQAVRTWALDFHKLGASEAEIRGALEWSAETHDNRAHGFARPDHLRRIKARILSARQRSTTPTAPSRGPQDEAAEAAACQRFEAEWAAMTEDERRAIEEQVIAANPLFRPHDLNRDGYMFRSAVRAFIEGRSPASAGPSDGGSPGRVSREQSG
jgi:hypothetical protein